MPNHELVFFSTDDFVDDHVRPAHDMVLSMNADGKLALASPEEASFDFDDPDTGQSFTIVAFKSYTVTLGVEATLDGARVASISGYVDLKHRTEGLMIQDPLLTFEDGQSLQVLGKNFMISPDDLPSIFDDTSTCIYTRNTPQ